MKFFIPNPGATVRVRLHTGEVVDAIYGENYFKKYHWLEINGETVVAGFEKPAKETDDCFQGVRFIGPYCDLVPT
jgi:hypothetical protein